MLDYHPSQLFTHDCFTTLDQPYKQREVTYDQPDTLFTCAGLIIGATGKH